MEQRFGGETRLWGGGEGLINPDQSPDKDWKWSLANSTE